MPNVPAVSVTSPSLWQWLLIAAVAVGSGTRSASPVVSSTASIAPRPRTSATAAYLLRSRSSRSRKSALDLPGPGRTGPRSRIVSMAPSAAAQATGLPPYVPPRPPACTESMTSARPVTAASGSPPAIPLAVVIRSGTTSSCSQANQSPVRQKPVWISSAMSRMPCSAQKSATWRSHPSGGTTKPPSPWIGSMTTAAVLVSPTWVCTMSTNAANACSAQCSGAARPAQRVGHRRPVDLGGEGAEAVLVRHVLRGQPHRQVRAAVVAVLEGDDRLPAGEGPRDLHGVLDGFGAGVEQRAPLLVVTGGELGERLADRDVLLVGRDHEAGVGEVRDLLLDPATTAGARCRRVVTAMPEPKSMRWLPSTSTRIPPPARSMYAGRPTPIPADTAAVLRACRAASGAGERGHEPALLGDGGSTGAEGERHGAHRRFPQRVRLSSRRPDRSAAIAGALDDGIRRRKRAVTPACWPGSLVEVGRHR